MQPNKLKEITDMEILEGEIVFYKTNVFSKLFHKIMKWISRH